MKYTNIEELKESARTITPGTRVKVEGYTDSKGRTYDIDATLLEAGGYRLMQKQSLAMLDAERKMPPVADLTSEQVSLAFQNLATGLFAAVNEQKNDSRPGPSYEQVCEGSSVHTLVDDAVYLLRAKSNVALPEFDIPKGEVPRSKALVSRALELPVSRYLHCIKLRNGGFKSVTIGE